MRMDYAQTWATSARYENVTASGYLKRWAVACLETTSENFYTVINIAVTLSFPRNSERFRNSKLELSRSRRLLYSIFLPPSKF